MLSNTEDLPELCSLIRNDTQKLDEVKFLLKPSYSNPKSLKFPQFVPLKPSIEKGEGTDLAADNGNRGKSFP